MKPVEYSLVPYAKYHTNNWVSAGNLGTITVTRKTGFTHSTQQEQFFLPRKQGEMEFESDFSPLLIYSHIFQDTHVLGL